MKKWNDFQNPVSGRYKLSTMVVSALLVGVLLWQGVFAMLVGGEGGHVAAEVMSAGAETFSAAAERNQRRDAWQNAVNNPSTQGGVWDAFWANANFSELSPANIAAIAEAVVEAGGGAAGASGSWWSNPSGSQGPVENIGDVGQVFIHNDIEWRVLYRNNVARTALIITESVFDVGVQYNGPENIYTGLPQSDLRKHLNTWAAGNLGGLRYHARVPLNVNYDVRMRITDTHPTAWNVSENAAMGRTRPGVRTNSDSAVFVLSLSEANRYFGPAGDYGNSAANNTARHTGRNWWLRSPGGNATFPVSLVHTNGALATENSTHVNVGFRPALWISI